MTTNTIFPNSAPDIENRILRYATSCPQALVNLSGTTSFAYAKLSNGVYFQQLFSAQHPLLAKTGEVFFQLKTHYQDCCWKVACCTLLKDYTPFSKEFLGRAIPSITFWIEAEKSECLAKKHAAECELESICGSHYADPISPIHQAWEAKTAGDARCSELKARLLDCDLANDAFMASLDEEELTRRRQGCARFEQELIQLLVPFSHDEAHIERFEKQDRFPPGLQLGQKRDYITIYLMRTFDEQFLSLCSKDISEIQDDCCFYYLDIALIEEYREACLSVLELAKAYRELLVSPETIEVKQAFLEANQHMLSSSKKYSELERGRMSLCLKMESNLRYMVMLNHKLADIIPFNRLDLLIDLYFAKHHEIITYDIFSLRITLRPFFLGQYLAANDGLLEQNIELIGRCLVKSKAGPIILEILYHQCANGVIEDQWAEKNFYKFSRELEHIVQKLATLSKDILKVYKENLDLSLKLYVDKNIEEIRKNLPVLKEMSDSLKQKIPTGGEPMKSQDITDFVRQTREIDPFFQTLLDTQSRYDQFSNVDVRQKLPSFLALLINTIESYPTKSFQE